MPEYTFDTPAPVDLVVEVGKGHLSVRCAETSTSTVSVTGHGADEVVVEQRGREIRIVEPRRGGFGRDRELRVDVAVPTDTDLTLQTGSADIEVTGQCGGGRVRSGSGDVELEHAEGDLRVETGSGNIGVERVGGELRAKSGSGDLSLSEVGGAVTVSTGSGDVDAGRVDGAAVIKTGSGDMHIGDLGDDLTTSTGSGDVAVDRVRRGRLTAKGASGSVRIGVPGGVPVWTDLLTVTGSIASDLESAGQPAEGQDHVELRIKTVSGDISLSQV